MNKFTQGHWQVNDTNPTYVEQANATQAIIAICDDLGVERSIEEYEANARLIAAAPELLEALKIIIQFYSDNIENMPVAFQTFADLAEQAIKKAKGE